MNVVRKIAQLRLNLHYRFRQRLHVVQLPINLASWADCDERMFLACFELLGRYVEEELRTEPDGYRGYREHAVDEDKKAIDLWLWYKRELPALKLEYDEYMDWFERNHKMSLGPPDDRRCREVIIENTHKDDLPKHLTKFRDDDDYIERIKDEKLKELIERRRTLWT